jgi:hypothetical protein
MHAHPIMTHENLDQLLSLVLSLEVHARDAADRARLSHHTTGDITSFLDARRGTPFTEYTAREIWCQAIVVRTNFREFPLCEVRGKLDATGKRT